MKRMNYIRTLYFSAIIAGLGSMVSCGDYPAIKAIIQV